MERLTPPDCQKCTDDRLCPEHELEMAEYEVERWMDKVEELKQQIKKEKEDASNIRRS